MVLPAGPHKEVQRLNPGPGGGTARRPGVPQRRLADPGGSTGSTIRLHRPPALSILWRAAQRGQGAHLLALRRFAEEADDLRQPAVGVDLADVDRRLASTSIGADQ